MFKIPGQMFQCLKDVETAISYEPNHISLYGLETIGTPFGKMCKSVIGLMKIKNNMRKCIYRH